MIARRLLLNKLTVVAPAVADNEMIRVLTFVCFTGTHLIATNYGQRWKGGIAISTPRSSEFKGCIPAAIFTDLLAKSRAAVVELEADGDWVVVKLGTATIKLPVQPVEVFADLFTMPTLPQQNVLKGITSRFFAAVEHCLQSVEENSTCPDKLGITVIPDGNELRLFSTNSVTMSRATVPLATSNGIEQRVILSASFCRAMLNQARRAHTIRLAICPADDDLAPDGHALFAADDTLLFGKLIKSDRPVDYNHVFTAHVPSFEHLVPIPHRRFGPVLQRANRVVGVVGSEPYSEITVTDGTAKIHARSQRGEIVETIRLPGHPDVKLKVHLSNLPRAYKAFAPEKILFGERAVVLARGDHQHIIATGIG